MNKILESNNYGNFEMLGFNRDVIKTKKLEASMRQHGFLDAYPCHVVQNGAGKFKIKAGHHRFVVASKLGIPIKFVVCNDNASIYELEGATVKWSIADYLNSYCRMGKVDYLKVKDYVDTTGVGIANAANILAGAMACSGVDGSFKQGTYKVKQPNQADTIKEYLEYCKNLGIECYNANHFVNAFSRLLFVKEFNIDLMTDKTTKYKPLFEKKLNLDQYLDMFEDVYNRQGHQKIPLKFLAYEASKARCGGFGFKKGHKNFHIKG